MVSDNGDFGFSASSDMAKAVALTKSMVEMMGMMTLTIDDDIDGQADLDDRDVVVPDGSFAVRATP